MELFVVGKINRENYLEWEFIGIFDKKELAEKECLDDTYFVGPCVLNNAVHERVNWPKAYFPKGEDYGIDRGEI